MKNPDAFLHLCRQAICFAKRHCTVENIKRNPLASSITAAILLILMLSLFISPRGRIIPLGPEMVEAYKLLESTETGRDLIKKVEKETKGALVYMMLSSAKDNELLQYPGLQIRGVTRAHFKSFSNIHKPAGILIYTNDDITYGQPYEIVKNIAFELENVIHSMKYPGIEFGQDSPNALLTQKLVCMELGM